jgi:hypothetical protein
LDIAIVDHRSLELTRIIKLCKYIEEEPEKFNGIDKGRVSLLLEKAQKVC